MHILICNKSPVPVFAYGGTERVVWDLAKCLVEKSHKVSLLVPKGSRCPFAQVIYLDDELPLQSQIPSNVDVVHFQFNPGIDFECSTPWLVTQHGNSDLNAPLPQNTVFVSKNHAVRHGAACHVYNGLDWSAYGPVDLDAKRNHFHFLGKASWRVKNVQGAIDISKQAHVPLMVLGGTRLNIKRGFRLTLARNVTFLGMVGGETKLKALQQSKGLIFPARWHEPFGLAVIESLYFGCPVFGTPYGALPEIVSADCGVLSDHEKVLIESVKNKYFDPRACHARSVELFNVSRMTEAYLRVYEQVLDRDILNYKNPVMLESAVRLPWITH
jgi:glycosyltransferase involved in cell wall biosynthesis